MKFSVNIYLLRRDDTVTSFLKLNLESYLMKPFLSNGEVQRKEIARKLSCNPCPGRKQKHYQRITRKLDQVIARVRFYLEQTGYSDRKCPIQAVVVSSRDRFI